MRRLLVCLALMVVVLPAAQASAELCPNGVQPRREIRTLSADELDRFVSAVRRLQSGPPPTVFDKLVKQHIDVADAIHMRASFFAWHRAYVRAFERLLQASDPTVTVPYWDTGLDAAQPATSPVFATFGTNGVGPDHLVSDGPFATLQLAYPTVHGLSRAFLPGPGIAPFPTTAAINAIITSSASYAELRSRFEGFPHGAVHNQIGGDMKRLDSPNDPLFWIWHANVDRIWALWQQSHPDVAHSYGGTNADGSKATVSDRLSPFNLRVGDVLDTSSLCYAYDAAAAPTVQPTAAVVPSSTALTVDRAVITPDDTATLVATSNESEGYGAIAFLSDGQPISGCSEVPLRFVGSRWQAACETSGYTITAVNRALTARFLGASAIAPSTSPPVAIAVVNRAPELNFSTPQRASYGDPLGPGRLDATAAQPGTIAYAVRRADGSDDFRPVTEKTVLPAGSYRLRASFSPAHAGPGQVAIVPLRIDPAPLTIVPDKKTVAVGEPDPELTWTGSGFVHGDTPSSLAQAPVCWIEQNGRAVGGHAIRCTSDVSPNYAVSYPRTATLTVRRKPCADSSACASDDPPTTSEQAAQDRLGFVCALPIFRSDRKLIVSDSGARPGVVVTTWRASMT